MPLYFAYGSNMDVAALRARCPKARRVDTASLARHRFGIMANGWASVARHATASVHGVLFELALSDVPALDRYEDVAHGLYVKAQQRVVRGGGLSCKALIYLGTEPRLGGTPPPGYMEAIVAAAREAGLPASYIAGLEGFVPRGADAGRGPAHPEDVRSR